MNTNNNDSTVEAATPPLLPRTFASPWTALYLCLVYHRGMRPALRVPAKHGDRASSEAP